MKSLFTRKVLHLASLWKWDFWNSETAYLDHNTTGIIVSVTQPYDTQPYDKFFQMSVKENVRKWKWWMFLKQVLFHFYSLGCHRLLAVRLRVCLWSRWQWFHRSRIFCSGLPAFWDVLSLVFPFCVCGYSGNYCQRCYGWENWVQGLPRVLCISDWSVIVMLLHVRTNT